MENLKAELIKGTKALVAAERLRDTLVETVENLRKLKGHVHKSKSVDLEIFILHAESTLKVVKELELI